MGKVRYNFDGSDIELPLLLSGGFHNFNYSIELGEHRHTTGPEITYVMKGFTEWHLEDGTRLEHPGGTVAIVPAGVGHHGAENVITPCWLFWYVLDLRDMQRARHNTPFSPDEISHIFKVFSVRRGCSIPASASLTRDFEQLFVLLNRNDKDGWFYADIRILLCRIILDTARLLEKGGENGRHSLAVRAREYMKKNIIGNISVDDIAAACGLSESQFARRFKRETGITPADCLQRLRIETACRVLRQTTRSITDIAFELGFNSSQYFSTVFKRYTGTSPLAYRTRSTD